MAKRARKRSKGKGRRCARRNPMGSGLRLALGAAALAAAGYGGYRGYRYFKARRGTSRPGLEGGGGPLGPQQITCEIGPSYPGFVQAEDGTCAPSGTTPPGIYVDVACADFVFVPGDDGPQPDLLEKLIAAARAQAMVPQAPSADPILITSAYLHAFWPACEWPPASDGPARLIHMYEAICFIVGRTIVEQGGRVLGTRNASIVDDLIADRLSKLGLPDFDQEIVPELPIEGPDRWLGPEPVPPTTGDVTGTGAPATEIERLKGKLCSDPEDLNAFERITLINDVISPILDTRVANLGADPTLQQLDNMFASIGRRVLQGCPVTQRRPGIALAKKMAHDLWIQRYNQGQQLDTDVPPPPPFEPIPPGPGGVSGGELPVCAVEPYRRTKSVDLPQLSWATRKVYETKIFEFSGAYEACHDYELLVGVCLRVPAGSPYGLLSQYIADPTAEVLSLASFRIQNIHQEAIDFNEFRSPPAYKQQIRARIRLVELPNGQRYADTGVARDNVTGSGAGAMVDPCPALVDHWPRPAAGAYNVVAWDGAWYNWDALPTVEIVDRDMAVYLRVTYTGVPAFNWKPEHDDARVVFSLTEPVLQIKSVATGNTP